MNKTLLELVEKVVEGNSKGLKLVVRISDTHCVVRDALNEYCDLIEWNEFSNFDWQFGSGFDNYSDLCINKINEMILEMEVNK